MKTLFEEFYLQLTKSELVNLSIGLACKFNGRRVHGALKC